MPHEKRARAAPFSREFIELTLRFAERAAQVQRRPLEDALLHFTPLYLGFGLGRDFDARHPVWRSFVDGLAAAPARADWTRAFYLERHALAGDAPPGAAFGCFSYALWSAPRVRLHFQNADESGASPLGLERRPQRVAELTAMFAALRRTVPATAIVVGGSWLYNLDAYRRLFPPAFLATARVGEGEYQFLAQWGQLLDRTGGLRPAAAQIFLDRLERHDGGSDLAECFPFRVLRLEAPIALFYEFYGVDGAT